jgi:hypothetical protein
VFRHTFCTVVPFARVAEAVGECAFLFSKLPVILSLEMHASPKQQHRLALAMVEHFGDTLLQVRLAGAFRGRVPTFETSFSLPSICPVPHCLSLDLICIVPQHAELVATGRAILLSPLELAYRVLVKGKAKVSEKKRKNSEHRREVLSHTKWISSRFHHGRELRRTSSLERSSSGTTPISAFRKLVRAKNYMRIVPPHVIISLDGQATTPRFPTMLRASSSSEDLACGTRGQMRIVSSAASLARPKFALIVRKSSNAEDLTCKTGDAVRESSTGAVARKTRASGQQGSPAETFYTECIAVRSLPVPSFLANERGKRHLPITSMKEDRLLREMGVTSAERHQIEGLSTISTRNGVALTEAQLALRAIVRLAARPPVEVGRLQRRTARWHLRPFPHGCRFSGQNMSPLPAWLSGAPARIAHQGHRVTPRCCRASR